jgi:ParB-like chromosome segregation protein Spo0J
MSDFPCYKVQSVAELIPYANNSRTHSEAQVAKIAASIKEFGFLNPVIVDGENGIIAGHGRVLAAKLVGLDSVPVVEAAHLTDAQRKAYVIADNRLALDAGWDDEILRVEFEALEEAGFDLSLTGFDLDEIAAPAPLDYSDANSEIDIDDFEDTIELKFSLSIEQHQAVIDALAKINASKEIALLTALGI